MTTLMYDTIAAGVPRLHVAHPHAPVAGYVTGNSDIEWSRADFAMWARHVAICQQPADDATAQIARVIDVETGAATAADVPGFLERRAKAGHPDDGTVYVNLSTVLPVVQACQEAGVEVPRWWLAWYPAGVINPDRLTVAQVLDELHALSGVVLDPARVWAWQYAGGPLASWDVSKVFGAKDFDR